MILPDMNFMWWQASLASNYSSSTKSLTNLRHRYSEILQLLYEWITDSEIFAIKNIFDLIASNEECRNTGNRYNHNIKMK